MFFILASLALAALIFLAFGRGFFWRPLFDDPCRDPQLWPEVDIIVPARNEAEVLPASLPALLSQLYGGSYRVLLVNDHSTDGTGDLARQLAEKKGKSDKLVVIDAPDLPAGWSGKVAAMKAGLTQSSAPFVLFTDADILHPAGSLRDLVARAEANKFDLTSLMVKLNCATLAEKLLIPAFVFFFAMLYPFRWTNNPWSRTAAAAGGVMLVRREALEKAGSLEVIKGALIDDCALARAIKDSGGKIHLALTRTVRSLRVYPDFRDIHDMIARTAYTQLNKSPLLLFLSLLTIALVFVLPFGAAMALDLPTAFMGNMGYLVMALLYLPMVRFYGLSVFWAGTLPFAALFYMVATLTSARRTWAGRGGAWKGRTQ